MKTFFVLLLVLAVLFAQVDAFKGKGKGKGKGHSGSHSGSRDGSSSSSDSSSDLPTPTPTPTPTIFVGTCASGAESTIQDGVDAAATGQTVFVCPGTYTEDVVIDNPVDLQGARGSEGTELVGSLDINAGGRGTIISRINFSGFILVKRQFSTLLNIYAGETVIANNTFLLNVFANTAIYVDSAVDSVDINGNLFDFEEGAEDSSYAVDISEDSASTAPAGQDLVIRNNVAYINSFVEADDVRGLTITGNNITLYGDSSEVLDLDGDLENIVLSDNNINVDEETCGGEIDVVYVGGGGEISGIVIENNFANITCEASDGEYFLYVDSEVSGINVTSNTYEGYSGFDLASDTEDIRITLNDFRIREQNDAYLVDSTTDDNQMNLQVVLNKITYQDQPSGTTVDDTSITNTDGVAVSGNNVRLSPNKIIVEIAPATL